MRSIEDMKTRGEDQKAMQAARLKEMAGWKHERALTMANLIGRAAAQQNVWRTSESAEDYLARLGFDLTKI